MICAFSKQAEAKNRAYQIPGHGMAHLLAEANPQVRNAFDEITEAMIRAETEYLRIRGSLSWKVTLPLRYGYNLLFGLRKK